MGTRRMTTVECWCPVTGFEGSYEISDRGRVRSLDRIVIKCDGSRYPCKGRVLAQNLRHGQLCVALSRANRTHQRSVAALMRQAGLAA